MVNATAGRWPGLGLAAAATLLSWAAGPSLAIAQEETAQTDVGVDEVVVTARRREEALLDTPVAITALRADELLARGATDLAEVGASAPNVSFSGGAGDSGVGSAIIFIRGVGQTDYANSSDPGVGTYIDGVYIGRTIGGLLELADIAQVEVLRGPQGTLFGKNTIGGAINITTKQPSDESRASLMLTAGEDSRFNVDADADLVLSPQFGLHAAIATRNQDGFVRRLNGGEATGAEEAVTGRASALWRPTPATDVLLSVDYSDIGGTTPRVVTNISAPPGSLAATWNAFFSGPPGSQTIDNRFATRDLRSTNATGSFDNSYEGGGAALRVEHEFSPALTVRSISAYRTFDAFSEADQDGQSIAWGFVRYADEQEQWSQELNFFGDAFDERLNWILGLYYFTETAEADQLVDLASPIIRFTNLFATDTVSYAAFGEATWRFTDRFSASLGARATKDEKEFEAATFCRPDVPPPRDPVGVCGTVIGGVRYFLPPTEADGEWDSVDPRVGVQFRPTEDTLLYASYATGYKSGGFNARANAAFFVLPYDPESVDSYEVGFKGAFDEGRLQLAGALFRYNYEDFQVTYTGSIDPDGSGPIPAIATGFADNVGAAEVQGVELEAVLRPTEHLTFNAALGYIDSKITELDAAFIAQVRAGTGVAVSLANELPRTPEWTFNLGAEARTPLSFGEITWRADFSFIDEQFSEISNFERTKSPAHNNLNLRIAYAPPSERWTLALYGRNVTDEVYAINGFLPDGGNGAQTLIVPNEPREVGVQLKVNFGGG